MPSTSKATFWTARVLHVLLVLFFVFDAAMELSNTAEVQSGFAQLGYHGSIPLIGGMLLVSVLLYAAPRTAPLGALLLTGYLGGAVATHFLMNQELMALTPFVFGVLVWAPLWLRDKRVRELLPLLK